jgi:hypothetical protein
LVLQVIEDVLEKFPLLTHRRGELAADAFYRSSEKTAVVEFDLAQTVRAELVSFSFENLCVLLDPAA